MISPSSTSRRRSRPTKRPHRPSTASTTKTLAILLLSLSLHLNHQLTISAKEITATNEWQLLQENDTIPAGLHVRMDLSTGEKWAKLPSSDENEESIKAAAVESDGGGHVAEMDASGALTIVSNDDDDTNNNGKSSNDNDSKQTTKDYKMMHRVMSQLPPEELAPFGGLPALPSPSSNGTTTKLTAVELQEFEAKMELLWQHRQDELQKMQSDGSIADLPKILRERIETLKGYLMDSSHELMELLEGRRRSIDHDEEEDGTSNSSSSANNIIEALRDLEFQLSDVDMARDFHTLGGWPYLIALLDDTLHGGHDDDDVNDEIRVLVDEIRALAATTIGTAVSNFGEFRHWALEDVSSTMNEMRTSSNNNDKNEKMTALSLLTRVFQEELDQRTEAMAGGTMAVEGPSHTVAMAKSRATFKLRAIYGLGSLLRGNPTAQQQFILSNGPDVLVRNVLGTLSNVRGPTSADPSLSRLDYKFASKVLALGEDVVMDVVLHDQEYIQIDESATDDVKNKYAAERVTTANQLVASFTTEQWCDLSLRMLAPPTEVVGEMSSRGIKERALSAVRAMAPSCQKVYAQEEVDGDIVWGVEEVKRVRVEWNREGSGDGLDPVYRKELLDLVDGVLGVLQ
ncbi:putative nucleotide exchange factor [Skeletonema marinoi]|uniref:Nucleotide exchange factor n=1 Tax=Skeletonema marinoi TaxID=267567 RepID=A0AAD8Y813_9STRA|nr:putative nucleotide exchange factor [Skeletonema marinoi]